MGILQQHQLPTNKGPILNLTLPQTSNKPQSWERQTSSMIVTTPAWPMELLLLLSISPVTSLNPVMSTLIQRRPRRMVLERVAGVSKVKRYKMKASTLPTLVVDPILALTLPD